MSRLGLLACLTSLVAGVATATPPAADVQDVTFQGPAGPVLIRLHVLVDGRPYRAAYRAAWDDYLAALFRHLDRDGDGQLSEAEAARLPPPPQPTGGTGRPTNLAFNFRVVDADGNGKLDLAELGAYYREYGGDGLLVGLAPRPRGSPTALVAGSPETAPGMVPGDSGNAGAALFSRLDADKDGRLSAAELAAAEAVLMALDRDGDELLTAAELDPEPTSVPAAATRARFFPANRTGGGRSPFTFPGLGGKVTTAADVAPDVELVVRLGKTQPGEVAVQLLGPQKGSVTARPSGDGTVILTSGSARVELRVNEGQPVLLANLREQYLAQFRAAVQGGKGHVTPREAQVANFFPAQFPLLDQNGDGRLTEAELLAYLDGVQERQARALTRVVSLLVSGEGRGLFDLLDRNRDGVLSRREVRGAARLLAQLGREKEGLAAADVPSTYGLAVGLCQAGYDRAGGHGTFSPRGLPLLVLDWSRPDLLWFPRMDRNRDGDVSPREFLGSRDQFRRLDADGDGLISPEEALRASELFPETENPTQNKAPVKGGRR